MSLWCRRTPHVDAAANNGTIPLNCHTVLIWPNNSVRVCVCALTYTGSPCICVHNTHGIEVMCVVRLGSVKTSRIFVNLIFEHYSQLSN